MSMGRALTNGFTGQISAVTFFAKIRKKVAIKNLLGEPGVGPHWRAIEMPRSFVEIQVFVASPSDVQKERELLGAVIDELNRNWSSTLGVRLRLLRWETDVYPAFGSDPQAVINEQIGDDYDVFIGILWGRFGTPTSRAESGTMEEFKRALSRRKGSSSGPEIMVYFKDSPISPTKIDPDQLIKIRQFRADLPGIGGLYAEFSDEPGFEAALRAHLAAIARKFSLHPTGKTSAIDSDAELPVDDDDEDLGYLDYIESYEARMSDMTETLSSISSATERVGADFNQRTEETRKFTESEDRSNIRTAKSIIKRAADDMNAYGRHLEAQLPLLAAAREEAFTALTKALVLYGGFGEVNEGNLADLRNSLDGFNEATGNSRHSLAGLRKSIASMSRMTGDLNRAKKFVVSMLDEMDSEIERAQVASSSILVSIDQMIKA